MGTELWQKVLDSFEEVGEEEEGGGEGEVGGGSEGDWMEAGGVAVEDQEEEGREADCPGEGAEKGDEGGGAGQRQGERIEVAKGCSGDGVSEAGCFSERGREGVLPTVDEQAVKAAEKRDERGCGKESEAEGGGSGDSGDEDGGGEEEAHGDLLWEPVGAAGGVDKGEVAGDEGTEDEIEVDGLGGEAGDEGGEGGGGGEDAEEEGGAMAMVEVVAMLEVGGGERIGGAEGALQRLE